LVEGDKNREKKGFWKIIFAFSFVLFISRSTKCFANDVVKVLRILSDFGNKKANQREITRPLTSLSHTPPSLPADIDKKRFAKSKLNSLIH
jgi:hypothetical protein